VVNRCYSLVFINFLFKPDSKRNTDVYFPYAQLNDETNVQYRTHVSRNSIGLVVGLSIVGIIATAIFIGMCWHINQDFKCWPRRSSLSQLDTVEQCTSSPPTQPRGYYLPTPVILGDEFQTSDVDFSLQSNSNTAGRQTSKFFNALKGNLQSRPHNAPVNSSTPSSHETERAPAHDVSLVERDCQICGDQKSSSEFPERATSLCTHRSNSCQECISNWIQSQMDNNNLQEIRCMESNCSMVFSYSDIRSHASQEVFSKYVKHISANLKTEN
jgi:hypothetical protein